MTEPMAGSGQTAAMQAMMLRYMGPGVALFGADRRLRAANETAAALSGLPAQAFASGRTIDDLIDQQRHLGVFGIGPDAAREAERKKQTDLRHGGTGVLRLHDGRVIDWTASPMPDGGFVLTWMDNSARARAEEAAERRAALLQGTLDAVRHGIALYGPDRRLAVANRLAAPSHGLPPLADRIGARFEDLVEEQRLQGIFGEGPAARQLSEEVIALDRSRPVRYHRRLPDGRVMEVGSEPTPEGGFVVTHTDVTELVEAQAQASHRAALLQTMQDSMRHGIALYDAGQRLVAANRLAGQMTGLGDIDALLGLTLAELLERQVTLGEITPEFASAMRARAGATPALFLHTRPDGSMVEITCDPTPQGGFVLTFSDVTARTRLEEEARRRADILQVMLDNIRHGICYYGADQRVVAANALAEDLGGHSPGRLTPGRTLSELVADQKESGAFGGDANAFVAMALALDRSRPHSYLRPHRDGRVIEVTSDPTPDGGFVITTSDITALVRAEAEAQRRATMQEVMLDTIRHGILLVDGAGRVVAANRVFRQLLDLPAEQVAPGRPFTDFVDFLAERGEYGPGEAGALAAASIRERDRVRSVRTVRTRPDGTVLEAVSDPTPDGGWVLTFSDLTAERRAQAELARARDAAEAANRAKSRFLATMSHELRTPLNAVIGFSETLLAAPASGSGSEYVRAILEAGRHLLSLIDDILDVARAETGGFEVAEGVVDLDELIAGAVRVMGAAAQAEDVALQIDVAQPLPRVRGDALRLRQVLLNLLSNAVKFTPAGGRVDLRAAAEPEAGGVAIRIVDTGIGMPIEDIPRAFEPFTQLDNALSRRFSGSGLGLYLSKALAAAQGAALTLESAPGKGTTATLHFPPDRLVDR
jgi:signal transduction histidine kinase